MGYSVGQVADATGITIRTLHHYDEIGLLCPRGRSTAGYRRYDDADITRLHQILLYRELGFPLFRVASILDDPQPDPASQLRHQHELLTERIRRLQGMVAAIEHLLEAEQMGTALTPEERLELFGSDFSEDYAEEAEQRWGDTEAYRQSQRRTAGYTKADWQRISAETADLEQRSAAALNAGVPADSEPAMDLAEEHRQQISRWFYDCGYEMHRGLTSMYVQDDRFKARYEAIAPGLAEYLREAADANADRANADRADAG